MNQQTALVVRPVRFTDRIQPMRDLLVLLGLRQRLETERGGWIDLVGADGMVALHDAAGSVTGARPGETHLSFECEDASALARRLHVAGYDDATVVDEAYGRALLVTGPTGEQVQVDERSDDLYGYRRHAPTDSEVGVVVVRVSDRPDDERRLLEALGAADVSGRVEVVAGAGEARLELVAPDLDAVAARLGAAGVPVTRYDAPAPYLEVVDPDGESIRVRSRS